MANLVSNSFRFVSITKGASFPVSTPIGKETRSEEQCQDVKRFKNRGLRPIITGNEWKRNGNEREQETSKNDVVKDDKETAEDEARMAVSPSWGCM